MKISTKFLMLILFGLTGINHQSTAQEQWISSDEYISIQQQSINNIESYGDLLDNIITETQDGKINQYFEPHNPKQIFQDTRVLVTNEINPKSNTFPSVEIQNYLNYWFSHAKNKASGQTNKITVLVKNIFISPVFLENNIAFTKVYFEKHITYNDKTDILNEFAIIRSTYQGDSWLSLISGIGMLDEKVKISDSCTVKEMPSVRNDLGKLTETILNDSTIISYNNFKKFITPFYSRTNVANKYTSVYYYDNNLYQCAINAYKVLLQKDSISIINPEIEAVFHQSGFNIKNKNTGFQSQLTGEKNLEISLPGCFPFVMKNETAFISNNKHVELQSSHENDKIDFSQASNYLKNLSYNNFAVDINYSNYQLEFLLKEDRINIKYRDFAKEKTIYTSNTRLYNMELINVGSETTINDFYIDKNEVTVADYNKFVAETGYITEVEKRGWSYIVETNFSSDRKYSPSGDEGLSNYLKLEKGHGVNWKCNEFGKPLYMISQDTNRPVIHISYHDALQYCKWAGKQLPYREEMLFAAKELINGGNFDNYVMFSSTSGGKINKVRQKLETDTHIWDILGNVYEWCSDWVCNEKENQNCLKKHIFGGYWDAHPEELKTNQESEVASAGSSLIGFRGVIRKVE